MQKVIAVNLNGNAYQVDEEGYDALLAYLDAANRQLKDNPDRAEIIADLEQAIADKCQRVLGPYKTVVSANEVTQILNEMGPVDGGAGNASAQAGGDTASAPRPGAHRRLYRIPDDAIIAGVCNGIAAYLHIDPWIVRVIFVVLLFATGGGWAIVYFVLAVVVPPAITAEERASAYGEAFSAKDLIDRAKRSYEGAHAGWRRTWHHDRVEARRQWRQRIRESRRQWRNNIRSWPGSSWYGPPAPAGYATRVVLGVLLPIFAILSIVLFWAMLYAIFTLVTEQAVFGRPLPGDVPVWIAIVIVVVVYQALAWPFHAARRSAYFAIGGTSATAAALEGLVTAAIVVLGVWLAYVYLPEVRAVLQALPDVLRSFRDSVSS